MWLILGEIYFLDSVIDSSRVKGSAATRDEDVRQTSGSMETGDRRFWRP